MARKFFGQNCFTCALGSNYCDLFYKVRSGSICNIGPILEWISPYLGCGNWRFDSFFINLDMLYLHEARDELTVWF